MVQTDNNYERLYRTRGGKNSGGPEIPSSFGTLCIFDTLGKGDITKYEEIAETNYILCLNQLALLSYRQEIEEFQHRQAMRK
jgi:hypothetical protein